VTTEASLKASEEAAFSDVYVARRGSLRRTAHLLCGDWHEAEDLVHTAFARLYVAWPRLRNVDSVDAYLRRTLMHESPTPGVVQLSGPQLRHIAVGRGGRFVATVRPGEYRVTGNSPLYGGGHYLCQTGDHAPVAVGSGASVSVNVLCVEK
jgi:hypothetical protein